MMNNYLLSCLVLLLIVPFLFIPAYALVKIDIRGNATRILPKVLGEQSEISNINQKPASNKNTNAHNSPTISLVDVFGKTQIIIDNEIDLETIDGPVNIKNDNESGFIDIKHGEITAETKFPINIDSISKTIKIATSGGTLSLNILPQEAVNTVQNDTIFNSTPSKMPANIQLEIEQNNLVYKINGALNEKFLGILPVAVTKAAIVSANTGKILRVDYDLVNRVLESISF